jgi:hypothetical protein
VVSSFLNDFVNSPLPIDGLACLVEFLKLSDSSINQARVIGLGLAKASNVNQISRATTTINARASSSFGMDIFRMLSLCETDTLIVKNQISMVAGLQEKQDKRVESSNLSPHSGVSVPTNAMLSLSSYQFRDALYSALKDVLRERDEIHSRLVRSELLHMNETEELRRNISDLSIKIQSLKNDKVVEVEQTSDISEDKNSMSQRLDSKSSYNSDSELQSLCQQLSGEIIARTAAEMEVLRLNESRIIEQKQDATDKQVLEKEVMRLKEALLQKDALLEQAQQENRHNKKYTTKNGQ